MKKVLQISNYIYPHIGGIEQVTRDILDTLNEWPGFEQKIICFNEDAKDGEFICERGKTVKDIVDGVEVIRCGCITKKASQSISLSFPSELKKVMNDFSPDIVIFHYPNPYQAEFFQAYLKRSFKLILYWHLDITRQKILGKLFHSQTIRLLERADRIVATSPNYIDGSPYLSKYREKCVVIPNCITEERLHVTDAIHTKAEMIRTQNEGKTICFAVGRHVPYKGMTFLVQASKLLDNSFRIFIGGQGELTESLKKEVKDDDKITFLGRISDEDLVSWFLAMDIFCFPSITKNEAFGIALVEAMYFGKPVVTFSINGSGVNYVSIKGVTGIEVPNGDVYAYAEALEKLAKDKVYSKLIGAAGKKRVEELFIRSKFTSNLSTVIQELS